jgi:hypothetical protein
VNKLTEFEQYEQEKKVQANALISRLKLTATVFFAVTLGLLTSILTLEKKHEALKCKVEMLEANNSILFRALKQCREED